MILKNLFAALIPHILMIIWAVYLVVRSINNGQSTEMILSSVTLALFILFSIITIVKVIRHPNNPTYLTR